MLSGPWFNIKMTSYQYRKSHCGDKTILRPSYLHNGISYTGKTSSYWIGAQVISSHGTEYIKWTDPCLPQRKITTTNTIKMTGNNSIWKYIFMFPQNDSTSKVLKYNICYWDMTIEFFSIMVDLLMHITVKLFEPCVMIKWYFFKGYPFFMTSI